MGIYRTAQIAAMVGVHPNTVRFYEKQGLLCPVPRQRNGYRCYTKRHLSQLRLIRTALAAEILSDSLRDEAVAVLKLAADGNITAAVSATLEYRGHIEAELQRAERAIGWIEDGALQQLADAGTEAVFGRRRAAQQLGISVDVLRDWERNGLIDVARDKNGRGRYGGREMSLLNIISMLRNAHYSQMAIRRMLQRWKTGSEGLRSAIDTPDGEEDIVHATDRYISALQDALDDTERMLELLEGLG